MKRRSMAVVGLLIAGLLVTLGPSGPAWAHEERSVGPYGIEVGFGDEPAYAGFRNSVQLIVTDTRSDSPVVDLGDSVKVTVMTGQASMDLSLEPNLEIGGDGEPGDYRAVHPHQPGHLHLPVHREDRKYAFNQTFASGPQTFAASTPGGDHVHRAAPPGALVHACAEGGGRGRRERQERPGPGEAAGVARFAPDIAPRGIHGHLEDGVQGRRSRHRRLVLVSVWALRPASGISPE